LTTPRVAVSHPGWSGSGGGSCGGLTSWSRRWQLQLPGIRQKRSHALATLSTGSPLWLRPLSSGNAVGERVTGGVERAGHSMREVRRLAVLPATCQQLNLVQPCEAPSRLWGWVRIPAGKWQGRRQGHGPHGRGEVFTRQRSPRPWPGLRHMHAIAGGQQRGSSSDHARPRETPRFTTSALVGWLVMRGFVVDGLPGFLDGMQGVRGSNPLSSTRHNATSTPAVRRCSIAVAMRAAHLGVVCR
jgi:hypothetical protein